MSDKIRRLVASLLALGSEALAPVRATLDAAATLVSRPFAEPASFRLRNVYRVECFGPDGRLKWADVAENTTVNEGLDDVLDKFWKGSAYTAAHYVGLTDGTPTPAAGDTMASHAGWVEVHTEYDEATRETLTLGTVASQSVDNSASKASYTINGTATVGGAFVTTNSTKNGSTGTLIGIAAFTGGDKAVASGDTLNVTVTLTAATA